MYPTTTDNREIVMTSLFPAGLYLQFAGAGDDRTAGRGQGSPFITSTTLAVTTPVVWSFNDWVYMSGGKATWDNAVAGDKISMTLSAPATTYKANATGTGGATLNATTGLITATPGAGNIDIVNPVPVPNFTGNGGNGTWVWTYPGWAPGQTSAAPEPPTGMGIVVPQMAGYDINRSWTYDMYAGPVPLATFVTNMQIFGTRQADMTLPAIKPQMILPHWVMTANVVSSVARTAPLTVTWLLTVARCATV